jgi:iron complex transport system ATP-binding protein
MRSHGRAGAAEATMLGDDMSDALIAFSHVTVIRDGVTVLDDFSLVIPAGQHVAVVGPNGSGKSTVLKVITRELRPLDRPETYVTVLGQDRWTLWDLRAAVGIVSNDLLATCTRKITGRELLLSGFFGSIGLWPHHEPTSAMHARVDELLAWLGLPYLADRMLTRMSSGEARRLLIGRALIHRPRALVLDEPMTSLDLGAAHEVRATMRALAQQGTSLVLVTHDLADIVPEIGRVVLLRQGRIAGDGTPAAVLTTASLTALYDRPVEVTHRDGHYHAW